MNHPSDPISHIFTVTADTASHEQRPSVLFHGFSPKSVGICFALLTVLRCVQQHCEHFSSNEMLIILFVCFECWTVHEGMLKCASLSEQLDWIATGAVASQLIVQCALDKGHKNPHCGYLMY